MNKHIENETDKLIKVNSVPFDKVYFGMPQYIGKTMKLNRPLFVTQYKGIASIFAVSRNDKIRNIIRGTGYKNLGYDEWELPKSQLQDYLTELHIQVQGGKDFPEKTFDLSGYVYEIDISQLKDNIYQHPWMTKDREFLISNVDEVKFTGIRKVDIKTYVKHYDSKPIKETFESYDNESIIINEESTDVSINTSEVNIIQDGFEEIRALLTGDYITEANEEAKRLRKNAQEFIRKEFGTTNPKSMTSKQRNRMMRWLKDNDYDPKTNTIKTDIKDINGKPVRVNLGTNVSVPELGYYGTTPYYAVKLPVYDEANMTETDKKMFKDDREFMNIPKSYMKRHPSISNGISKHEEGHIAHKTYRLDDSIDQAREADDHIQKLRDQGRTMSPTHTTSDELIADKYSVEHNKYKDKLRFFNSIKSSDIYMMKEFNSSMRRIIKLVHDKKMIDESSLKAMKKSLKTIISANKAILLQEKILLKNKDIQPYKRNLLERHVKQLEICIKAYENVLKKWFVDKLLFRKISDDDAKYAINGALWIDAKAAVDKAIEENDADIDIRKEYVSKFVKEYVDETIDRFDTFMEEFIEESTSRSLKDVKKHQQEVSKHSDITDKVGFHKLIKKKMETTNGYENATGASGVTTSKTGTTNISLTSVDFKIDSPAEKLFNRLFDIVKNFNGSTSQISTATRKELFDILGLPDNQWDIYPNRCFTKGDDKIGFKTLKLVIFKSTGRTRVFPQVGYRFFHASNNPDIAKEGLKPSLGSTHGFIDQETGKPTINRSYNKKSCFFMAIKNNESLLYDIIDKAFRYGAYLYEYKPRRGDTFYEDLFSRPGHTSVTKDLLNIPGTIPVFINSNTPLPVKRIDKNVKTKLLDRDKKVVKDTISSSNDTMHYISAEYKKFKQKSERLVKILETVKSQIKSANTQSELYEALWEFIGVSDLRVDACDDKCYDIIKASDKNDNIESIKKKMIDVITKCQEDIINDNKSNRNYLYQQRYKPLKQYIDNQRQEIQDIDRELKSHKNHPAFESYIDETIDRFDAFMEEFNSLTDQYTMRNATNRDLEFVYQSELETVGENKDDPKVQRYIRNDAKKSLGHTKIIVMDHQDIGVYQAYETNYYGLREGKLDWWYLAHIYIKPDYRNKGIGSDIIKKDIDKHDKILLQVMKSNTRARKLYESFGFVVDMENNHGGLVMRLDKSR